jgi:hypothetical protein
MDTDNPDGPEASIEDRLLASFAPEAADADAPAVAEPVATEEPSEGDEPAEPTEQDEQDASFVDVEDDDGATHKVPAALKDAFLRRTDYTRKAMGAANLAKTAEDRIQYAEAREQFTAGVMHEVAEVRAMHMRLKEFDGLDLGQLYNSDPGTALRIRDQRDELRRQIQEKEQGIQAKARNLGEMTNAHFAKQWQLAVEGAKQRIGTFTPGEDMAMRKQMEALGFTEKELAGRFADPRVLHAIYKAAKWDTLQAGKGKAVATAQSAPPVVKPGASKGPGVAAERQWREAREALKKTGSDAAAQRLFMLRG